MNWVNRAAQTMDGKQGIQLVRLISPKLTIPVHFDDYDVFAVSAATFFAVSCEADGRLWADDSRPGLTLRKRSSRLDWGKRCSTSIGGTLSSLGSGDDTTSFIWRRKI